MSKGQTIRDGSFAVFVRMVGFLVVVAAVVAIVAALVGLVLGYLTMKSALVGVGAAILCILLAVAAERPFDPLRS